MSSVLPPPLAFRSRAAVASSLAGHPLPLVEAADRSRAPRSAERCVGVHPKDTARCRSLAWGGRARFPFARGGRRLPCCSPAPARRRLAVGLLHELLTTRTSNTSREPACRDGLASQLA